MVNKEELLEKMFEYYKVGINEVDSLIDLKKEIKNNLETLEGVELELDSCRIEFGVVSQKEERYKFLDDMWNGLNYLKTEYQKRGV
jgi:hypothetical protein